MSGFLSRWQQRRDEVAKQEAEEQLASTAALSREQDAEQTPLNNDAVNENEHSGSEQMGSEQMGSEQTEAEQPDAEQSKVLTAEDLPDPDTIEVGGSFASFMAKNVDPAAKAAALKALWRQPQYNQVDGLLEYALDYTNQPKLSSIESAEIARKVFRHIIKDDEKETETEQPIQVAERDQGVPYTSDEVEGAPLAREEDQLAVEGNQGSDIASGSDDAIAKVTVNQVNTNAANTHS